MICRGVGLSCRPTDGWHWNTITDHTESEATDTQTWPGMTWHYYSHVKIFFLHEIALVFIQILLRNTLTAQSSFAVRMVIRAEHQIMASNVNCRVRLFFSCISFLLIRVGDTQSQQLDGVPSQDQRGSGICNQPLPSWSHTCSAIIQNVPSKNKSHTQSFFHRALKKDFHCSTVITCSKKRGVSHKTEHNVCTSDGVKWPRKSSPVCENRYHNSQWERQQWHLQGRFLQEEHGEVDTRKKRRRDWGR